MQVLQSHLHGTTTAACEMRQVKHSLDEERLCLAVPAPHVSLLSVLQARDKILLFERNLMRLILAPIEFLLVAGVSPCAFL